MTYWCRCIVSEWSAAGYDAQCGHVRPRWTSYHTQFNAKSSIECSARAQCGVAAVEWLVDLCLNERISLRAWTVHVVCLAELYVRRDSGNADHDVQYDGPAAENDHSSDTSERRWCPAVCRPPISGRRLCVIRQFVCLGLRCCRWRRRGRRWRRWGD